MNQNVVNYLQENKDKFAQDDLVSQLGTAGYGEADIAEGVAVVYGGTPMPVAQTKYAGFWIRWAASFIDGLVLIIPHFIVGFIFSIMTAGIAAKVLVNIASFAVTWIYFIFMTNKYQATLGKKVVGIKVISNKSDKLTLGQIVLRETVGKLASAFILLIGYLMIAFTSRKQGLHDMIADTVVVYKDPNKKTPTWIFIIVFILPIIASIGILASIVLVSLNSARNKAQNAATKASLNMHMQKEASTINSSQSQNNARSNAQDASIKSSVSSNIVVANFYKNNNGSLIGFTPDFGTNFYDCSDKPVANISPDGKDMAIFAKLCSNPTTYFCVDMNSNSVEVDQTYAMSKKTDCGMKK